MFAMPREITLLRKDPDLVAKYSASFGQEEKLKQAHTKLLVFVFGCHSKTPTCGFSLLALYGKLAWAGRIQLHHRPQQGSLWQRRSEPRRLQPQPRGAGRLHDLSACVPHAFFTHGGLSVYAGDLCCDDRDTACPAERDCLGQSHLSVLP